AKAAKILNIPRTTLYYKIEQYNINVSKNRQ
ncbi:MAG: helix-turn-helix domain-containing protein, partial [Paeniclostridium sp.]